MKRKVFQLEICLNLYKFFFKSVSDFLFKKNSKVLEHTDLNYVRVIC